MNRSSIAVAAGAFALLIGSVSAWAGAVKISGTHNCCPRCSQKINQVLAGVGATGVKLGPTEISFEAAKPDDAVKALFDAGFTGKVEGGKAPELPAPGAKAKSFTFVGVHNCCGQCDRGIKAALKGLGTVESAPGTDKLKVTTETETTADVLLKALRAAGFAARLEKL